MHLARLKGIATLCALAVAGAAIVALVGCTTVGQSVTGVSVTGAGPTTCVKACNDYYALQYKEEQKTHLANVETCQALAQPEKNDCLNAESIRHAAAKDALGIAKVECQNDCHRQGTGSAG